MKVSILGATGYAGVELLRLLHNHPQVEIMHLTSESHTDEELDKIYPHLFNIYKNKLNSLSNIKQIAADSDFIFIALPHGHSMKIVKDIAEYPTRVIDLGADYRFENINTYEHWYKTKHLDPQAKAVYGLAELNKEAISTAKLIGNAGCYTTASILALAPLVKHKLIATDSIIIDAKSGVTGAGRSPKLISHYPEFYDNFTSYGAVTHRHTPEIEEKLSLLADTHIELNFTPHLLPIDRGILATCYANLALNATPEAINEAYNQMYEDKYFIRLLGLGKYPATKAVRGSNFCDIGWHIDPRTHRIIIYSAIDNLVKGAAGQAIQNFNIACGFEETTGLDYIPMYP